MGTMLPNRLYIIMRLYPKNKETKAVLQLVGYKAAITRVGNKVAVVEGRDGAIATRIGGIPLWCRLILILPLIIKMEMGMG